jgi:hypothetical protein
MVQRQIAINFEAICVRVTPILAQTAAA